MNKLFVAAALSALALGLSACQKEGPMEKAGEKMDNAVKDVKEGVEETGEKIDQKVEEHKDDANGTQPAPQN